MGLELDDLDAACTTVFFEVSQGGVCEMEEKLDESRGFLAWYSKQRHCETDVLLGTGLMDCPVQYSA